MVCFLVTTYNRQQSCQRLVDSLQGLGHIIVLNDGCDYHITGCEQHVLTHHHGRNSYWRVVKTLFTFAKGYQYYIMLPDDFLICDSQIAKAIEIWNEIRDPRKICLNLYADRIGKQCWTVFKPVDKGTVWHTQWVDMCFLAEDLFFREVRLTQPTYTATSSGVGAVISRRLHRSRYNLYQVKESLVEPQFEHTISQIHDKNNIGHSFNPKSRRFFSSSSELSR